MGSETSINLISPGHFLCHVPGCTTLVHLKDFNDLTLVILHFKAHLLPGQESSFANDESCEVLLRRHNHLKKRKGALGSKDLAEIIEELESQSNKAGQSFPIRDLIVNKLIVEAGQAFKGSVNHTELSVMKRIADHDPNALSTVRGGQPSIGDYFKK